MKILRNSARCKHCGEEVVSKHRHDFRTCSCGKVAVDGGHDYLKRSGNPEDREETSVAKEPREDEMAARERLSRPAILDEDEEPAWKK